MIENQQTISCAFIGEQEVGKTSLINKFFRKITLPITQYNPTIAVQISYSSYQCQQGTILRIKCWDTAGQNKYKNMVCYHLKDVDIIVIMFDITNVISFNKIDQWIIRLKNQNVYPKLLYLVGNKYDIVKKDENLRKVTKKQAENKAKQIKAIYVQISVHINQQFDFLNDAFEQILSSRAQKIIQINMKKTNLDLQALQNIDKNQINSSCQCSIF